MSVKEILSADDDPNEVELTIASLEQDPSRRGVHGRRDA